MNYIDQTRVISLKIKDLGQAARIHIKSFPKSLLSVIGEESIIRYYEWQFKSGAKIYPIGLYVNNKLAGYCIGGVFKAAMGGFIARNKVFLIIQILRNPSILLMGKFLKNIFYIIKLSIYFTIKRNIPDNNEGESKKYFGILAIAVDPEYQNNGFGKILLSRSEAYASENKFTHMRLTADIENENTIRFYESNGWTKNNNDNWSGQMIKEI